MDGLEATRRILGVRGSGAADHHPDHVRPGPVRLRGTGGGASGFLLKDVSPEHLIAAVQLVRTGDALLAPTITRRLVERFAAPRPGVARTRPVRTNTARGRGARPDRARPQQRRARRLADAQRGDGQDPCRADPHQAGLRDRVQAVVLAYETGLSPPAAAPPVRHPDSVRALSRPVPARPRACPAAYLPLGARTGISAEVRCSEELCVKAA